jgi:hypothetical protein
MAPASPNAGLLSPGRPLSMIGISMADNKDLRWIDEYGDELTMAIATRDWDEAVKLVEKGEERVLIPVLIPRPSTIEVRIQQSCSSRPIVSTLGLTENTPDHSSYLRSLFTYVTERTSGKACVASDPT